MKNILKINSSVRYNDSVSRQLTDKLVQKICNNADTVVKRDLNTDMFFLTERSLQAVAQEVHERNNEQKELANMADEMIGELQQADIIVIGAPVYNFSASASLKAWADLVARVGTTFNYLETGPVGLLKNKKAYIVAVSGGTEIGGEADFMTPWLKFFLGFIGINDVEVIIADGIMGQDGEEKIQAAHKKIDLLTA